MYTFFNATTQDRYASVKKELTFEHVPNTAVGYENCRKYIIWNGYKYFVSANNEKDFFLHCDNIFCPSDKEFSVYFSVDGDRITINHATNNGRMESADKYLKKYASVLCMVHSCIKYDKIVQYRPYRAA